MNGEICVCLIFISCIGPNAKMMKNNIYSRILWNGKHVTILMELELKGRRYDYMYTFFTVQFDVKSLIENFF